MTPKQFKELREGDVIRNLDGHGYFVLRNHGPILGVLVQRTVSIHHPESWELTGRLKPELPEPTICEMVLALERAKFRYSESPSPHWEAPCGGKFSSLVQAYKSLNAL